LAMKILPEVNGEWSMVNGVGALFTIHYSLFTELLLLAGNRLGRALTGPGIGVRALAAHRQRAAMTQAAIAAQIHQPLDVHRHFAAQVTLNLVVAVDRLADLQHLRVGQLVDPPLRRDADLLHDLGGKFRSDALDIL